MKRVLLAALGIAVALILVMSFVPLSTEPVRIVWLRDAPDSITLEPGKHLRQRLHLSVGTYSAIALFSDLQTLDGRVIHAKIEGRNGETITQSAAQTVSYRSSANVARIEIPLQWFTVTHDDFYVMDITLTHGEGLPLRIMPRDSNLPAVHKLSLDGAPQNAIVSLSFMKRVPPVPLGDSGLVQGGMIGSALLLAVALMSTIQNPKKKYWVAVLIIILFAPLAVMGYWFSTGDLGIADWDFYFTLHDSYRKAILTNHTFPFWNPYICGGTAGLGDPEFPVFSPTFLLEFLFGIPLGIRMAITLSIIVTASGMLALARSLGRSVEAGLIAALAVAFGTVSLLEITEGHVNVFAAMWIPWILYSWLQSYRGKMKPIVCAVFLALAFLGGGIYLLMYTTFAFIALIICVSDRRRAALRTLQSGLWALGLVSFKLVPVLLWLRQFPDGAYQSSTYTLPWIMDILFGRYLHGSYIIPNQASGWHEYGAYIGYAVGLLALIGLSRFWKSRVIRALAVASIVTILVSALGPYLKPVFDPLWFFPRSNISRLILFAVIPLALLAAYGADRIAKIFPRGGKAVRTLLVGIVAIDIISLTYQLSEQAFVLPHVVPQVSPAPYPIAFTPNRYDDLGSGSTHTRSFDAYKAGYGTLVYCSVLGPTPSVRTIYDEGDTEAVSVLDKKAKVSLVSWNYNTVRVHVDAPENTQVVLNTNYANGWMANGKQASIVSNRVAAEVSAGSSDIVFQYKTPGFRLGILITLSTIIALLFLRRGKKESR